MISQHLISTSKQTGIRAPTPYSGIVKCAAMRVRGIGVGVGSGMVIGIVKQGKGSVDIVIVVMVKA